MKPIMRKALIAAIAFVVSAVVGVLLSLLIAVAVGYPWMAFFQRDHSGIGAVAGGISETAIILVPILWGHYWDAYCPSPYRTPRILVRSNTSHLVVEDEILIAHAKTANSRQLEDVQEPRRIHGVSYSFRSFDQAE
jgi:hypothetical protein